MTSGSITSGIDFALSSGGTITGKITDALTGLPLAYRFFLFLYDAGGGLAGVQFTDANGFFAFSGLHTGSYFVATDFNGYLDVLYNGMPCPIDCDPTFGTPIAVTFGSTTSGIDITLGTGGAVTGTVTDAVTGLPLANQYSVKLYDAGGNLLDSEGTDATGSYRFAGLPDGSYFVTMATADYSDELYDDLPCPFGCAVTGGTPIVVSSDSTTSGIDFALGDRCAAVGDCTPGDTTLCLLDDNRFEVTVSFETVQGGGRTGDARAVSLDPLNIRKGGIFYFLDSANPEFLVKVIDGCGVNDRFWVFYAATTNIGFELTVRDTATESTKIYSNPDLYTADTVADVGAFATCDSRAGHSAGAAGSSRLNDVAASLRPGDAAVSPLPGGGAGSGAPDGLAKAGSTRAGDCVSDATTLCLPGDDRFAVSVEFETVQAGGRMGDAQAVPLDVLGVEKGGVLYFFDPGNPEFLVKIIDGCGVNNHHWVFYAATTNIGFELTVTDTATDTTKIYANPDLNPAFTITDTQAFATCGSPRR